MSTSIYRFEPIWTDAGIALAHSLRDNGVELTITHVAVGSGIGNTGYTPSPAQLQLVNEIERTSIIGGVPFDYGRSMQLNAFIEGNTLEYTVTEVGFFHDTTLVLVFSDPARVIFRKTAGLGMAMPLTISLRRFRELAAGAVITVVNSPDLPAMYLIMAGHLAQANPHPQYAGRQAFDNFVDFNDFEHDQIFLLIDQEESDRIFGDQQLNQRIDDLELALSQVYPKVIASGVYTYGGANLSSTDGWFRDGSLKIANNVGVNMLDTRYTVQLTPEGGHEAWGITRHADGFSPSIFNRSGTNRIGYGGMVSWSVVENRSPSINDGIGEYFEYESRIALIEPNQTRTFILVGGGGGGGASGYSGVVFNDATDGQSSTIRFFDPMNNEIASLAAFGGNGGTNGVWSNGSAYFDGDGGIGGSTSVFTPFVDAMFNIIDDFLGEAGHDSLADHSGGSTSYIGNDSGTGGAGADGVGDLGYAFGGGGGGGGYLKFEFTNLTGQDVYFYLNVGARGIGATRQSGSGFDGQDGRGGFIKVTL